MNKRLIGLAAGLLSISLAQTVTVQYWHINTENFGAPALKELVAEFQKRNPNIRIEERFQQGSYTGLLQNLQASIAAGNPPDVVQIGYLFTNYVQENFPFVPLNQLVKAGGGEEFVKRFPANVMALGQSDGVQIGMPYSLSNTVVYYNADMFKRAGLDPSKPPQTWAEWRSAARAVKEKTGKYGMYLQILDDNWVTEAMLSSNGGSLVACAADGTYRAGFASPAAVEAVQLWADMIKEGTILNTLAPQGEQAFLAGEVAVYATTIAKRQAFQTSAKFDLRGTTFPRFGDKPTRLPGGGNVLVGFSKDPAKQAATWKWIQFLTSDEGFTAWTKGTGYVPLLDKLDDDPRYLAEFVKQNPIQQVGIRQLNNTFRWTSFPGANGLAASQSLFKATQRALGGQASVQEAFAASAEEVNGLLRGERCKK